MQIATMLTLFTLWGVSGFRASRALRSIRAGLMAAVLSACICMSVGGTAALVVQLFLVRPSLAEVATWGEFKRSGWTDPRAFASRTRLTQALRISCLHPWSRRLPAASARFSADMEQRPAGASWPVNFLAAK